MASTPSSFPAFAIIHDIECLLPIKGNVRVGVNKEMVTVLGQSDWFQFTVNSIEAAAHLPVVKGMYSLVRLNTPFDHDGELLTTVLFKSSLTALFDAELDEKTFIDHCGPYHKTKNQLGHDLLYTLLTAMTTGFHKIALYTTGIFTSSLSKKPFIRHTIVSVENQKKGEKNELIGKLSPNDEEDGYMFPLKNVTIYVGRDSAMIFDNKNIHSVMMDRKSARSEILPCIIRMKSMIDVVFQMDCDEFPAIDKFYNFEVRHLRKSAADNEKEDSIEEARLLSSMRREDNEEKTRKVKMDNPPVKTAKVTSKAKGNTIKNTIINEPTRRKLKIAVMPKKPAVKMTRSKQQQSTKNKTIPVTRNTVRAPTIKETPPVEKTMNKVMSEKTVAIKTHNEDQKLIISTPRRPTVRKTKLNYVPRFTKIELDETIASLPFGVNDFPDLERRGELKPYCAEMVILLNDYRFYEQQKVNEPDIYYKNIKTAQYGVKKRTVHDLNVEFLYDEMMKLDPVAHTWGQLDREDQVKLLEIAANDVHPTLSVGDELLTKKVSDYFRTLGLTAGQKTSKNNNSKLGRKLKKTEEKIK